MEFLIELFGAGCRGVTRDLDYVKPKSSIDIAARIARLAFATSSKVDPILRGIVDRFCDRVVVIQV